MPTQFAFLTAHNGAPRLGRWDAETYVPDIKVAVDYSTAIGTAYSSISVHLPTDRVYIVHQANPYLTVLDISGDTYSTVSFGFTIPSVPNGGLLAPSGKELFVGANSGALFVFDVETNLNITSNYPAPPANVNNFAFSPDGRYVAMVMASSPGGTALRILDLQEMVYITPSGISHGTSVTGYRVAWSPDGKYICYTTNSSPGYYFIDTSTWANIAGIPTLPFPKHGVAFSPDSKMCAVGTINNSAYPAVTIFDIETLAIVYQTTFLGSANSVIFDPFGRHLLFSIQQGTTGSLGNHRAIDLDTRKDVPFPYYMNFNTAYATSMAFVQLPIAEIVGTVRDIVPNPAQRKVRIYRRSDGALIKEVMSDANGDFSVKVVDRTQGYDVQGMIADGEQLNDIILARVTPG